jgi:stage V sporulation protein B
MRVMMMIAIPCAVGLFALANPVMWAMFPQKKSVDIATFYLALLAVTVIFYCVSTVSNAVLQGTGRLRAPVVNAAVALVVQSALLVGLLVFTDMTGEALCIVTIVYSLLMCVLNNISIRKYMDTKIDIKQTYVLPFIASAVMGVVAYGVYRGMFLLIAPATASVNIRIPYFTSLGVAIVIAIFVYFAVLIKIGGATREDIRKFPKGASLVRVLEKIKLL